MNTCEICKFFELNSEPFRNEQGSFPATGWCRRNAPHPKLWISDENPPIFVAWPFVDGDDWCGEHVFRSVEIK
jgi:hypothetical protein